MGSILPVYSAWSPSSTPRCLTLFSGIQHLPKLQFIAFAAASFQPCKDGSFDSTLRETRDALAHHSQPSRSCPLKQRGLASKPTAILLMLLRRELTWLAQCRFHSGPIPPKYGAEHQGRKPHTAAAIKTVAAPSPPRQQAMGCLMSREAAKKKKEPADTTVLFQWGGGQCSPPTPHPDPAGQHKAFWCTSDCCR